MRHALLAALAVLAGAAPLAGCGGDDGGGGSMPAAAATSTIAIEDFVFEPARATVRPGAKITVRNGDAAPHTLTERPAGGRAAFDTGTLRGHRDTTFSAPAKPGTYAYYCALHPFMKGALVVAGG